MPVLGARAPRFFWPLLVTAGFLGLVGLTLIAFAFVPADDKRPGPPRGFTVATRLFDGYWAVVRGITDHL